MNLFACTRAARIFPCMLTIQCSFHETCVCVALGARIIVVTTVVMKPVPIKGSACSVLGHTSLEITSAPPCIV
jgi:hypothetical protein